MKQNSYITLILALALLITLSVSANEMTDASAAPESKYQPTAEQMIIDGLIYRPLSLAGTLLGTGLFIVTLPFSLIGGNAGQAGERLVLEPASATFDRCLGCLPGNSSSGYSH
jgi:hypothetical protein